MNVTVSVLGRFHAFYLARELERHGFLDCLITSYPKWAAARWGLPRGRIRSLWPIEAARRALHGRTLRRLRAGGAFHEVYDALAAQRLPKSTELVVAWSGSAESTLRRARERGCVTVVERCSSHIRAQGEILREEYARHGIEPDLPPPVIIAREEREYELADRIAVPSSFAERTFLDRGIDHNKLLRIPFGVDPAEFAPVPKEDGVFRVVYAGSLGVRKGTKYLLQAFAALDLPNSELLLLGTAREEATHWLARYRNRVRHFGHVPQGELYRMYSQGSVFVLPSVEEGMAYVQLQAMACGLPLICTAHTGGEDLIREGEDGFVIPIRDVEALQERLLWCYENPEELRDMGHSARRWVLSNFTWRDYGERVCAAYSELLESVA